MYRVFTAVYTSPHPWESRGKSLLFNPRCRPRATDVPATVSPAEKKEELDKERGEGLTVITRFFACTPRPSRIVRSAEKLGGGRGRGRSRFRALFPSRYRKRTLSATIARPGIVVFPQSAVSFDRSLKRAHLKTSPPR